MNFPALIPGRLLGRRQRFLADIELDSGQRIVAHCPNTGAMTGCREPGDRVWLSHSDSAKRKYSYTWELVEVSRPNRCLVCIHSARANALVAEAINDGQLIELAGYQQLRREVRCGTAGSRIDIMLSAPSRPDCFIEVKSVTLLRENGLGVFPDAPSVRARKHVRELMALAAAGQRAVMVFCALHAGVQRVAPAADIDPLYAATLREARHVGVEIIAYGAAISPERMVLCEQLPVLL